MISRICCIMLLLVSCCNPPADASDKWQGVDESVIEKYAKEHGRKARRPLIDTEQGDLLLFLFLAAGTIGGFAAGYSWRMLVERKRRTGGKSEHASS